MGWYQRRVHGNIKIIYNKCKLIYNRTNFLIYVIK